jgi:hypothetical protein
MSRVSQSMTREEVAAVVCSTLERHGIEVVLCGGSVVSIYSGNEFESYDLDFIPTGLARRVDPAMQGLGFQKEGRHWRHPQTRYWVEFPPGPVAIGEMRVKKFDQRVTSHGTLRLLRPTECVMDRLAAYVHWNDRQGLEQAIAVARRHPVNLAEIERWARDEGTRASLAVAEFLERLRSAARV